MKTFESKIEYDYWFTEDWFAQNIEVWKEILGQYVGRPNIHFLEIGSYEGMSAVWCLENVLTAQNSDITCIDTFQGGEEHALADMGKVEDRFLHNITPYGGKVNIYKGNSADILRSMRKKELFHMIYIDGSHQAKDVLTDAVLSFALLKKGGLLIFDDYGWGAPYPEHHKPKIAISAFLECFQDQFTLVATGYQIAVRKNW